MPRSGGGRSSGKPSPPAPRPMTPRDEVQHKRSSRAKKMQRQYSSDEMSEDSSGSEEISSDEELAPQPQPEPARAPTVVSQARSNMTPAQLKLLELVNKVQDVNLQALQIASDNDGGGVLDWPQICVVGGQAEGKSTLLSAIVSARMPSKMKFLPEGTGMVTRCPIEVQMTCPNGATEHKAIVRTQGQHGGLDSAADEVAGPGATPTPDQIDRWGQKIRKKIQQATDSLVQPGCITRDKVIVQLVGPCLPNLSLVDLPGLRAVDDPKTYGLKEELRAMVTDVVSSSNAIILCASAAGTDPATWVGKGLAREVDQAEERTVGVVTKVDQLYGIPDTQTMREDRAQLKQEIATATSTPYYAAYNPPVETEEAFRREGINLKETIESHFQKGHVGNDAIAAALEKKLADHLQAQLPAVYKQLKAKKAALDKELSTVPNPTWAHVEKVFLSYGRMVQAQANNDSRSAEMVEGKRTLGSHYDKFGKRFYTVRDQTKGMHSSTKAFNKKLTQLWDRFEESVSPAAIYDQAGAEESLLHLSTGEVLQWKSSLIASSMEDVNLLGSGVASMQKKSDSVAATTMARELADGLDSMMGQLLDKIEVDQVPEPDSRGSQIPGTVYYENSIPGIVTLCQDFYKVVAGFKFTLDPMLEGGQQAPSTVCSVDSFPKLNEMLQQGATGLLRKVWKKIREAADETQHTPTYEAVSKEYLDLKEIQDALKHLCDYTLDPKSLGSGSAPSSDAAPPEAQISGGQLHRRSTSSGMPAAKCWKKKPTLKTWPERYVRIMEDPGSENRVGLFVFDDETTGVLGDLGSARTTSIPDLNGCEVQECPPHSWGMLSSLPPSPKLKIFSPRGEVSEFAFMTEQDKTHFLEACTNLSQGRLWNQSLSDAEELNALAAPEPEAEDAEIEREYVRPTTGSMAEKWALNGGVQPEDSRWSEHKAQLLQVASPTFHKFYASVKSHVLQLKTDARQSSNPQAFFAPSAVAEEIEAESLRIWALQLVRVQMDKQVKAIQDTFKKLLDASSPDGPFSATAIFASVGFSSLIVQNLAPSNGMAGPGPAQLLQVANGIENREQKEMQQQAIERVLREFERSGLPEFV